jgi:hypothetical protein
MRELIECILLGNDEELSADQRLHSGLAEMQDRRT